MASSLEALSYNLLTESTDKYEMFENIENILTMMSYTYYVRKDFTLMSSWII